KDRFEAYRDIIYYTAAQMELERKNTQGAVNFLQLCIRNAGPGSPQRNKAFLQLAGLSFGDKRYRIAKSLYDSVNMIDLASRGEDISWLNDRKAALATLVSQLDVMARQDSLQRIAALPPAQRDALLKKMARSLRRLQGLKDEAEDESALASVGAQNKTVPDLFGGNNGSNASDWYFNNPNLKAKGYSDFKNRWGNRPNVDNWAISSMMQNSIQAGNTRSNPGFGADTAANVAGNRGIDYKSLLNGLPLTPEKLKKSNDSIEDALYTLGKTYQEGIPDYGLAINAYDSLLTKFPGTSREQQTLLNLYYCYLKLGDHANADRTLALLKGKFPTGAFTARAVNPDSVAGAENRLKVDATHQYEKIYDDFIEGRFAEAVDQKKVADSLYGDKYWTPQLLYIESVYFIRTNQDGEAHAILQSIVNKFPRTPMADKAATMMDVLSRRRQIEQYLTKLQIKKVEDTAVATNLPSPAASPGNRPGLVRNDSNMLKADSTSDWARAKAREAALARDTTAAKPIVVPGNKLPTGSNGVKAAGKDTAQLAAKLRTRNSAFVLDPNVPHSVVMVMTRVDPVYVSEARNAFNGYNQENFYSQNLTAENASLSDSVKMLVIGSFPTDKEAMTYMGSVRALAPRQIVPWLPQGKYFFLIISGANLQLLLTNKDLQAYRTFLSEAYPGKF
ncbi:MAG TPA: hypothetical protein VGR89_06675, partial [Puia sp.]|nr:hypothetical protein [Puia sp.]